MDMGKVTIVLEDEIERELRALCLWKGDMSHHTNNALRAWLEERKKKG